VFGDSIRLVTGNTSDPATLRLAGLLFIAIILCRNGAEVLFRGPLVDFGDPSATASGIRNAIGTFRLAIAADIVMAAADAAPAILLYVIFRPVAQVLALAAMVFRLIQSVMVAMNLLHMQSALILTTGARDPVTEALGVVPPPCRAYPAGGGHGNLA